MIDEFARLELAVGLCLVRLDRPSNSRKATFGQRVAELSKAKPSPRLSKAKAEALGTLAPDCEPLQRLRASVVHGVMEPGFRNGEPVAFFRNVADLIGNEAICHVLTHSEFQDSIRAVRAMTHRVETSVNQPVQPQSDPLPRT